MTRPILRLHRSLLESVRADLARPHAFAFERVGFLYGRTEALDAGGVLVLLREYDPVPDADYVRDRSHGATIGSTAIRRALGHALATGDSVVHVHEHPGSPAPSTTDRRTHRELTPTYVSAAPLAAHGALVLGTDGAYCVLRLPGRQSLTPASTRVVGFPLALWETPDGT